MKRIVFLFYIAPWVAFAVEPADTCPNGYVSITESAMTIASTCPDGTVSAGVAETCLAESPAGSCIIYAPAGVSYEDASGTYEFAEPCPM